MIRWWSPVGIIIWLNGISNVKLARDVRDCVCDEPGDTLLNSFHA
jgi:hypothetical protein